MTQDIKLFLHIRAMKSRSYQEQYILYADGSFILNFVIIVLSKCSVLWQQINLNTFVLLIVFVKV